ncbi:DUF2584 domain-containing protein [Amphibacillus sp. MSJ-3]|uniref:DUF2584 domain-containing protein n=1 Tax=Amphibacillus sp. MSJ-3 TaxID=2841505 RepID=UPI00209D8A3E|nr:DUF2584 domain-containing protein [Amphibacillus sp. MSJ-3]
MPLTLEWILVTEGKEERISDQPNSFTITLNGYRLFPVEQMIEIKRHKETDQIGFGKITKLTWSNNQTVCYYRLISLNSVN